MSKGAVDAITGKARYTLSDDRLLQDDVESHMLVGAAAATWVI